MRFLKKAATTAELAPKEVLANLPERFRLPLLSVYAGELQPGANGQMHPINSRASIMPAQGMWIYDMCRRLKPKMTAEIGLAYGCSTIYILAALHENGLGSHVAIDPFQSEHFHDIGLRQPEKVGMTHVFRFLREKSSTALVDLSRRGERFEFTFIDGNHRFDNALVDFTLAAEVCPLDGYIVLDDMWLPSIQRAVSFVRKNRKDFTEIPTPIRNIAAFKRIDEDTREWDHYVDF